jgi:hypothetical protein
MISTSEIKSIVYPSSTVQRAERALFCSPFLLPLFIKMLTDSVSLQAIALNSGLENKYTKKTLSELAAETAMTWLIQVGLLRREVDGQGLTDSFRLTPLGRQLTEKWQLSGGILPQPSLIDHIVNLINQLLAQLSIFN